MATTLRAFSPLLLLAALTLTLTLTLCAAAPKVEIRVVSRPRPVADNEPVAIRDPVWMAKGPFALDLAHLDCVKGASASFQDEKHLVDVCALRNVTSIKQTEEEAAEDGEAPPRLTAEPEKRRLLGIFRGWKVDPITLQYKQMMFDDGDVCSGRERFSFSLELVPSKSELTKARVVGLEQVDTCKFAGKLVAHVPAHDQVAAEGIHTHGVEDITDAAASLPGICGKMKCSYSEISAQVRHVNLQLRTLRQSVEELTGEDSSLLANFTMQSSASTLDLSSAVLDKALGLLSSLEELHAKAAKAATGGTDGGEQPREAVNDESDEVLREELEATAES